MDTTRLNEDGRREAPRWYCRTYRDDPFVRLLRAITAPDDWSASLQAQKRERYRPVLVAKDGALTDAGRYALRRFAEEMA